MLNILDKDVTVADPDGGTGGTCPPVWGNFLLRDLIHQSHWYVLLKFNKTKKLRRLFKSESTESNKSRHLDLLPSMHLKIPACGCAHAHGTSRVIAICIYTALS